MRLTGGKVKLTVLFYMESRGEKYSKFHPSRKKRNNVRNWGLTGLIILLKIE